MQGCATPDGVCPALTVQTAARVLRHDSAPNVPILRDGDPVTGDTNAGLSSLVVRSRLLEAHSPEFPRQVVPAGVSV